MGVNTNSGSRRVGPRLSLPVQGLASSDRHTLKKSAGGVFFARGEGDQSAAENRLEVALFSGVGRKTFTVVPSGSEVMSIFPPSSETRSWIPARPTPTPVPED